MSELSEMFDNDLSAFTMESRRLVDVDGKLAVTESTANQHDDVVKALEFQMKTLRRQLDDAAAISIHLHDGAASLSEFESLDECDYNTLRDRLHSFYLSRDAFFKLQDQFLKVSERWAQESGLRAAQKGVEARNTTAQKKRGTVDVADAPEKQVSAFTGVTI